MLASSAMRHWARLMSSPAYLLGCWLWRSLCGAQRRASSLMQRQPCASIVKSGIQRVVKSICANLSRCENGKIERIVAFSDSDEGWHRVTTGWDSELGFVDGSREDRVIFRGGDTILMLDSSWNLYKVHRRSLLSARLRGAEIVSCLYDMVPLCLEAMCHPGMPSGFSNWFKSALSYSTGFVCISRAVADQLHALLKAISFPRPMKIGYWRLGADFVDAFTSTGTRSSPWKRKRQPS